MSLIRMVARYPNIASDSLGEFKQVAAEMLKITRDEVDTGQYDFFISADERSCVIHESYANSKAALSHAANMGALLPRLVALGGGVQLEWFGDPSEELLAAAKNFNMDVIIYSKLQGL